MNSKDIYDEYKILCTQQIISSSKKKVQYTCKFLLYFLSGNL
jgi:hypothetical protein